MADPVYPTVAELHSQLLSDLRYGYATIGVTANVAKDSELWHRTLAVAKRLAVATQNGRLINKRINPLTATGDDLQEWAGIFGVTKRPATKSSGFVTIVVLSPATSLTVPASFKGTSASGKKYQTTAINVGVANGGAVKLESIDTGDSANLDEGEIITWDSSSITYLGTKATVAPGGIDGAADADDDEDLRARLLRRLGFPGVGGNWSQVQEWAEGANASVAFAAVYPTARGPSSYDVAIMGGGDDLSLNTTVQDQVASAIAAEMPGNVSLNVTSVTEEEIDAIIGLGLALPKSAGGAGGGWLDAVPWPSDNESGPNVFGEISAVTDTSSGLIQITVNSTSADPPLAGNRIAVWDYTEETMKHFSIVSVGGSSGAYTCVLDLFGSAADSFLESGLYVSPDAEYLDEYAAAFLASTKLLGCGEKSSNTDILFYARRKPGPDIERPYALTSLQLKGISDRAEVSDVSFAGRFSEGTKTTKTTPSVPATTALSPRILSLKRLSFRATL